jgi:hypothetical protein
MIRTILIACAFAATVMMGFSASPVFAQTSASEMLEQARARSREMEELKAVLNGPDQNMRLAAFDVMVTSGDEAMRQVALDLGLASADPLMQAMAFKETILSLNRIVFLLEIDTSQPASVQQKAQQILDSTGSSYTIAVTKPDRATGVFTVRSTNQGQVNGTNLTFKNAYDTGQFELVDETTIKGILNISKSGNGVFIATAKIR